MARPPRPRHGYYAKLTAREQRFVNEYLIDLNAYAAARRAGLSADNIHHLLNRGDVQAAIRERRELLEGERSNHFSAARFVLNKLWDIATADPRELVEVRRLPCRYCWGINGQYQFTNTEMDRIVKAYEYGGIKFGRTGEIIEVLMVDQDHARAMLAKHFGIAVERKEIALRIMDPKKLSDDELTQAIAELEILIEEQQQVSQETTPLRLTRPTE